MMDSLGDKIKSKIVANAVGVPTIPGDKKEVETIEEAKILLENVDIQL